MPKIREGGTEIDATFSVERLTDKIVAIYFESRSGGRNSPNARNTEYERGLEVLLQRLADRGAIIQSVALSPHGQDELFELKLESDYPLAMRDVVSIHDLSRLLKN